MTGFAPSNGSLRLASWALLVVALSSAGAFVTALLYTLSLFMQSLVGFPPRFVLLVAAPLVVSVAAASALAGLQLKATGGGTGPPVRTRRVTSSSRVSATAHCA